MNLIQLKSELDYRTRRELALVEELKTTQNRIESRQIEQEKNLKAISILQIGSGIARDIIRNKYQTVISDAIAGVTGLEKNFEIDISTHGNDIEALFLLDGNAHILDSHGGGIGDIISTILRFLILNMGNIDFPILLDEPTKNLHSEKYAERIGKLLKQYSKNRQLIVTTYSEELAAEADRVIRTKLVDGVTKIEVEIKE